MVAATTRPVEPAFAPPDEERRGGRREEEHAEEASDPLKGYAERFAWIATPAAKIACASGDWHRALAVYSLKLLRNILKARQQYSLLKWVVGQRARTLSLPPVEDGARRSLNPPTGIAFQSVQ